VVHPLAVGHERRAQRELADVADDGGGHVLVPLLAPRRLHRLLGEALLVEGELELPEILAGRIPRTLGDDEQGRELVQVVLDERAKRLEIVPGARAPVGAVAVRDLAQLVELLGDDDLVRRRPDGPIEVPRQRRD
jgi:hypothetical protein